MGKVVSFIMLLLLLSCNSWEDEWAVNEIVGIEIPACGGSESVSVDGGGDWSLDCVVETATGNSVVGDVYAFDFDNIPHIITWAGSAHEVEMLQTLRLVEINGDLPPVHIIGIVPEVLGEDTAFSLSENVKQGAKLMESQAIAYLAQNGITATKIANRDLQEIANLSFRGF